MAKTFFSGFSAGGDHEKNVRSSDEVMRPVGPGLQRWILHVFLPQELAPHVGMFYGLLCDNYPINYCLTLLSKAIFEYNVKYINDREV